MKTFVRAGNSRSFTRAASQLGISRSLVTRHIAHLEQRLGVTLFNRSTRGLNLTEEGGAYLQSCERILYDVEAAERDLSQGRGMPIGTLRVTAPKSFGLMQFGEALIDFAIAQPKIKISLTLGDFTFRPHDFADGGQDVAIRTVGISDSSVIARRIGTIQHVMCASPHYIARMGAPENLAQLAEAPCLTHTAANENERLWTFTGPAGDVSVKVDGPYRSNSSLSLRQAVLSHLGIGLLPAYCIADDIKSGRLVQILPEFQAVPQPLLVVYPQGIAVPVKVRVFVDFLAKWFAQRPLWAGN
ncbi:LysR family transcriptional regulator [Roseiarcaceae bacterium H3SJ34-1]|uniref:LysR family transcriptional regulator n=1 Tax=Terripilifer ovatus TaxID=3032367 RepID=UPI003AB985B8|nr:LysR family transcriptional regulator [Roseiarcaceae bacterium H3SJ34-1]